MGKGMRAGKKPKKKTKMGGANSQMAQMAQMQAVQQKMDEMQEELAKTETSASSGGGAVTVTVTGDKQVKGVELDPEIVDKDDIEMLQDLIITATNEALRKMEEIANEEMEKLTGSLGIPPGLL